MGLPLPAPRDRAGHLPVSRLWPLPHGDKVVFKRDAQGQAIEANAASVLFKRRSLPRAGETFRIRPVRGGWPN